MAIFLNVLFPKVAAKLEPFFNNNKKASGFTFVTHHLADYET
jgi:hypothetical protein